MRRDRTDELPGDSPEEAADPSMAVRPADERDIARIERLLAANDLPHEDLRAVPASFFVVTDTDGQKHVDAWPDRERGRRAARSRTTVR